MALPMRSDPPFSDAARSAVVRGQRLKVMLGDEACEVEGEAALAILAILASRDDDVAFDVYELPPEITTGQAADLLGVSRPTVVALIDDGHLAATRVGTHRRLKTVDVLAYRERTRLARRAALDEVVDASQDLGLYDE